MPETRWERIVAVAMLCATVVFCTLIFLNRETLGRESIPASSAPPLAAPSKVVSPVARVAGARLLAVPTAQRAAASPDTQRTKARLTLTASNGASFGVTVRAVSAQGRILYTGTLLEGRSVTATGKQLWVRFGAGAHPTVRLNGRPLQLDPRTSSALIVRRGMQQLQG